MFGVRTGAVRGETKSGDCVQIYRYIYPQSIMSYILYIKIQHWDPEVQIRGLNIYSI